MAAHGMAGGGAPTGAAPALLLVVAAVAGATAGRLHARSQSSTLGQTTALLAVLQLGAHYALSCGHPLAISAPMLGAHASATVGCAALLCAASRIGSAVRSAIHAITRAPQPPSWLTPAGPRQAEIPPLAARRACGPICPRAPPLPV